MIYVTIPLVSTEIALRQIKTLDNIYEISSIVHVFSWFPFPVSRLGQRNQSGRDVTYVRRPGTVWQGALRRGE